MNKEDIISSGELRNISRLRSDDMDDMKYGFDFNFEVLVGYISRLLKM